MIDFTTLQVKCEVCNIKFEFNENDDLNHGIYITTDEILNIDPSGKIYDDLLGCYLNLKNIDYFSLFQDKFGNKIDVQHNIPRRWLWEDFEEELKNGYSLLVNEYVDGLQKEKSEIDSILLKINLSKEELDKLGVSKKYKEISDSIDNCR